MFRRIIVTGGAVLILKVAYDKFIAPSVPDRVLVDALDLDTDDVALAVLAGIALGTIEELTRKVAPSA